MIRRFALPYILLLASAPLAAGAATLPPATLVVVGHADTKQAPDQATLRAQIVTSDRVAAVSRTKNDAITQRVVTALAGLGLPAQAVQTNDFQSEFVPRSKDTPADAPTDYVTTRRIIVITSPNRIEAVTQALCSGPGLRDSEIRVSS